MYNFQNFCAASGRSPEELPQLASELLAIGKNIVLNTNKSFPARVGGLYLIYGLYFKQQTKYIKLIINLLFIST